MARAYDVAILTGASSGIGWELARELTRKGTRVGLIARRRDQLQQLAAELKTEFACADVSDRAQAHAAVRELESKLGPADLLIANAGVGAPTRIEPEWNMADLEKMFRVNVFGVVYSIEAILPCMLSRRRGHIAAVSSLGAYKGLPGEWGYTSSKAALNNIMEGLRIELRGRGVHVTTVCPGFIKTPMTEKNKFHMPWLLKADDAARRIVRALERKEAVFNFPWQMSLFMTLVRWLPDWVVARYMKDYNDDPPMPDAPL
jgi:short-subunit dehydrogenase